MIIEKRNFGNSGIKIFPLGFGAGHIGSNQLTEGEIDNLLNSVLDIGINLIDTARGYGASEERIGKYISHRRNEFILSTKVGYDIPGYSDWTYDCIIAGVNSALQILKTDYIDIVHLHSCPLGTLEYGEVINALQKTVDDGKVRVAAYSGENNELDFSIHSGRFGSVQTSINIFDQKNLDYILPEAKKRGIGVIAKRPVGNVPWQYQEQPYGKYAEEYWLRMKKMNLDFGESWLGTALRFTAFTEGVDTFIAGTSNLNHLKSNLKILENGPLPEEIYSHIRNTFKQNDDNWIGQV
ncbi:MAG: aldo/keto reductase [Ignavibacteriaceae bacterium]